MIVRQVRSGTNIEIPGNLPQVLEIRGQNYITTTLFVKYNYIEKSTSQNQLETITVAALPNGMLQDMYNPTATDTIWLVGRNAPSRGEAFRVRLSFPKLKAKASWRVQSIPILPQTFQWDE